MQGHVQTRAATAYATRAAALCTPRGPQLFSHLRHLCSVYCHLSFWASLRFHISPVPFDEQRTSHNRDGNYSRCTATGVRHLHPHPYENTPSAPSRPRISWPASEKSVLTSPRYWCAHDNGGTTMSSAYTKARNTSECGSCLNLATIRAQHMRMCQGRMQVFLESHATRATQM